MVGRVHLLQKHHVRFDGTALESEREVRKSTDVDLPIEGIFPFDGKEDSIKLCTLLRSLAYPDRSKLKLTVTVTKLLPQFGEDSGKCRTKISIHGELINKLLKSLNNEDVILKVTFHSVDHYDRQNCYVNGDIATIGMSPRKQLRGNSIIFEDSPDSIDEKINRSVCYNNNEVLTLSILLSADVTELVPEDIKLSTTDTPFPVPEEYLSFMETLLKKNFQTDTTIVAANGSQHHCHKLLLTSNSSVFEAMFGNENYDEVKTQTVTMEDMSEEGVKAFLGYIYHLDVSAPLKDFDIAMELLEASEKYAIDRLKAPMSKLLLCVDETWKDPEKALRLFCFVRNIADCDELKQRALRILKLFRKDLTNLEQYKLLFTKNPLAAMELCNEFVNA